MSREREAVDEEFDVTVKAVNHAMACAISLSGIAHTPWSGSIVLALERVQFELRYFRIVEDKRRADEDERERESAT